jgi:hypothetical protein
MMPSDPLNTLRQVNASLRSALIRLHPQKAHCSTIRSEDFSDLLSEILRAAGCLGLGASVTSEGPMQQEMIEYRTNLEKLKLFLPELHGNLLAEKSRLETAQAHVATAAAWARASSRTF